MAARNRLRAAPASPSRSLLARSPTITTTKAATAMAAPTPSVRQTAAGGAGNGAGTGPAAGSNWGSSRVTSTTGAAR